MKQNVVRWDQPQKVISNKESIIHWLQRLFDGQSVVIQQVAAEEVRPS